MWNEQNIKSQLLNFDRLKIECLAEHAASKFCYINIHILCKEYVQRIKNNMVTLCCKIIYNAVRDVVQLVLIVSLFFL